MWSTVSVGGKTWPIDMCSNKDAGRSERETRTPCVKQAANRSKDMDKDRTTHYNKCITDRTRHDTTGQDTSLEHFSAKKVSLAIEALISRRSASQHFLPNENIITSSQ